MVKFKIIVNTEVISWSPTGVIKLFSDENFMCISSQKVIKVNDVRTIPIEMNFRNKNDGSIKNKLTRFV